MKDGTKQIVATDDSWEATNGPIAGDDNEDGEVYDARREMPGWDAPGFASDHWTKAVVVSNPTPPALVAQTDDGVQVDTEINPLSVKEPQPGVFVYDLGQNIVGWARLRVQGSAGAAITLRFAELLNPDGSLNRLSQDGAKSRDQYILAGGGIEMHEPRFTTHGFRYVELSGDVAQLNAKPDLGAVRGSSSTRRRPSRGRS
jgi:alpha-L-rhamnosidase